MLVNYKATSDPDVGYMWRSPGLRAADWLARAMTERASLQYLFYPSSHALPRHPWFREADVLQLYNTHGGYFSHSALATLSKKKPVVWRLSDMWPMTGHCAYAFECERWKTGCGACPRLGDAPALRTDRTALLWKAKKAIYARSRIDIVAPSRWMEGIATASPLLGRFPIHYIPNGLDPDTFRPVPVEAARDLFGVDRSANVLLFVSLDIDDLRKGGAVLLEAVERLAATGAAFHVMAVGHGSEQWARRLAVPVRAMPAISDDRLLAAAYSAADVFVMPTLAENLPNAVLESMACATPVVTFRIGGVVDAVRDGVTGWLAEPGSPADLASKLRQALADRAARERMALACRNVVTEEYTMALQASRFESLYTGLLEARRGAA